ncbi:MAG: hypothetical protein ACR2P1_27125, partial [Pseudomonadales bacterium]
YSASILFLDAQSHRLEKYALPILARNEHIARDTARRTFHIVYAQKGDIVALHISPLTKA